MNPRAVIAHRVVPALIWFVAALVPMVACQIVRLQQNDAGAWMFWDYAGRLGGLAVLAVIPSARAVAFRREQLRMVPWKVASWIVGIVLADHHLGGWTRRTLNTALPATTLGVYPQPSGWLYFIDIVFGIALVAYSEEIVFRRCAHHVFKNYVNDGVVLVVVTSLLFGAYHWWAGAGNVIEATIMGVLLILFFRRSGALWPVVLGHYLIDFVDFA